MFIRVKVPIFRNFEIYGYDFFNCHSDTGVEGNTLYLSSLQNFEICEKMNY